MALVSTGFGRVQRGFESFTESLFNALRPLGSDLDVTLFQGGGKSGEHRVVVPNLHRADFPARLFSDLTASHVEKRSFAAALYPILRAKHVDVVHYNELTMGSALFHLRHLFGGTYKLLYCNGAPSPPVHYHHRCDFAQILTEPDLAEATSFGIQQCRLFSLPYGIDADLFHPDQKQKRERIRQELGIPLGANLILSVAAIKAEHKRVDHLIREVSALSSNEWLVVAGQRTGETAQLEGMAEALIPGRWRFLSWPHARVAELYGAADCFALCSLTEAFGLVTVEAMLSELPLVVHDGPVFRWLAKGTSTQLIDMSEPEALTLALQQSIQRRATSEHSNALKLARQTASSRFSWQALVPKYLEMYRASIAN